MLCGEDPWCAEGAEGVGFTGCMEGTECFGGGLKTGEEPLDGVEGVSTKSSIKATLHRHN